MLVETRTAISGRLRSIDALRGAAALGVVLYHAAGTIVLPASSSGIERWTIQPVQWFSSFGYTGVFLFFVISGFCIHLQWARVAATGATPQIHFFAFWKRRVRRLYPPYLAALALYLIIALFTSRVQLNTFICGMCRFIC
jgi:peptidoglycan/LPS O-acetylase OafA/YrhL